MAGFLEKILFGDSEKRRPDRVSSKNKNRTGGQKSSGVGKNEAHLSPERKARGDKKQAHSVKAKGQRGSQGSRGAR